MLDKANQGGLPAGSERERLELEIKQLELAIRRAELENTVTPSRRINWSIVIPALATIGAAFVIFMSNAYVARQDREKLLDVEKAKLQSSLIISAVTTGDEASARKNLKIFLEFGLLDDPDGKIAKLTEEGRTPVLPVRPIGPDEAPRRECLPDAGQAFAASTINEPDVQVYVESCAYKTGDLYNYIYKIYNRSTKYSLVFRWKPIGISQNMANPLPPEHFASLSRTDSRPPSSSSTELLIGPAGRGRSIEAILPQDVPQDSEHR